MRCKAEQSSILIVDDITSNIKILAEILRNDYQLLIASSGPDALETLALRPVDLVLLDVNMPDMDGYEVCRCIKANEKNQSIPVIFVTAQGDEASEALGFAAGGVDYISKPIFPEILQSRVYTHIALKKLHDSLEQQVATRTQELQAALLEAKHLARVKSEFLANISHEIRTPLNAVIGLTYLCLNTELTDKQRDYLKKSHNSAQVLLQLLNDMIDFSRLGSEKLVLDDHVFSVQTLFKHLLSLVQWKSQEKGLELAVDIKEQVPANVRGDYKRILQILRNLVDNAIKFTETGGVVVGMDVEWETESDGVLRFSVCDTGIGMTEEQMETVFQFFSQVDGSICRKYGGTGLGLAISKSLVTMMNGHMTVESKPNQGSCFVFTAQIKKVVDLEVSEWPQVSAMEVGLARILPEEGDKRCEDEETFDVDPERLGPLFRRAAKLSAAFDMEVENVIAEIAPLVHGEARKKKLGSIQKALKIYDLEACLEEIQAWAKAEGICLDMV